MRLRFREEFVFIALAVASSAISARLYIGERLGSRLPISHEVREAPTTTLTEYEEHELIFESLEARSIANQRPLVVFPKEIRPIPLVHPRKDNTEVLAELKAMSRWELILVLNEPELHSVADIVLTLLPDHGRCHDSFEGIRRFLSFEGPVRRSGLVAYSGPDIMTFAIRQMGRVAETEQDYETLVEWLYAPSPVKGYDCQWRSAVARALMLTEHPHARKTLRQLYEELARSLNSEHSAPRDGDGFEPSLKSIECLMFQLEYAWNWGDRSFSSPEIRAGGVSRYRLVL